MPNHRIAKSISLSQKVNYGLSTKAQLIYAWQLAHLDDFGCLTANPDDVKALVFPKNKNITLKDIVNAINEMKATELIVLYSHEGKPYQQYVRFEDFQNFGDGYNRRSEYPPLLNQEHSVVGKKWGNLADACKPLPELGTHLPSSSSLSLSLSSPNPDSSPPSLKVSPSKMSAGIFDTLDLKVVGAFEKLGFAFRDDAAYRDFAVWLEELTDDFKDVAVSEEALKWRDYWDGNRRKVKRHKQSFRNWLSNAKVFKQNRN